MKQYYTLLGLRADAGFSELEQAYEKQLQKYEADVYDDDPAYRKRKRKELEEAYTAIRLFLEKGYDRTYDRSVGNREEAVKEPAENRPGAGENEAEKPETEKQTATLYETPLTIETPHADARLREIAERRKKTSMIGCLLLAGIILLIYLLPRAPEFDPSGYVSIKDYPNAKVSDLYVAEVAEAAKAYIKDYAVEHPGEYVLADNSEEGSDLQSRWEEAFLKAYWNRSSLDEVTDYLAVTYEGYHCTSDYAYYAVEGAVYAFYGFMERDKLIGYISPFSDQVIDSTLDVLKYYTVFYEEYSQGNISVD